MCLILSSVATAHSAHQGPTPTDAWGERRWTGVLLTVICTLPWQQSLVQKSRHALETGSEKMSPHPAFVLVASARGRGAEIAPASDVKEASTVLFQVEPVVSLLVCLPSGWMQEYVFIGLLWY